MKYYDMAIYNKNGEIIYTMDNIEADCVEEAREIIWDNFIHVAYADER